MNQSKVCQECGRDATAWSFAFERRVLVNEVAFCSGHLATFSNALMQNRHRSGGNNSPSTADEPEIDFDFLIYDRERGEWWVECVESTGERRFRISIGYFEGFALERELRGSNPTGRPLTHQLTVSIMAALGAAVECVVIDQLHHEPELMYTARLRVQAGALVEIDSRPSDALTLAVVAGKPILIKQSLLLPGNGDRV